MGRVKLQIKKIENTTNRQVTFSKRRNGLIKKAYELSVLCDVDVGLIIFSPSGRVSIFSGNNRSIEEIMARYLNLPEHERGRLHNQEYLQRALRRLKGEAGLHIHQQPSSLCVDSQLEELQQEIIRCKSQLMDMEKRLRVFEGDPSEITTLCEAEYREQILEETLKHVRTHKICITRGPVQAISAQPLVLEDKYNGVDAQAISQVHLPQDDINVHGLVKTTNPNHLLDWSPHRDPQVHILNFLNSSGYLPQRDEPQHIDNMITQPPSNLMCGQNVHMEEHMSPSSGLEDDHDAMNIMQHPEFGNAIDVNLSPWAQFYSAEFHSPTAFFRCI